MAATMGEGSTPLVTSLRIAARLGVRRLAFKLESTHPSGSYKDRFIAAEMTRILASGARACVATSSGNTGSSLAAYCARYDVRCTILVNEHTPEGKLAQMKAHGAEVIRVREFGSNASSTAEAFAMLREFSSSGNLPLVVSAFRYCPEGMRGVASLGREIAGSVPDLGHVFVPVGGGGLFSAVCLGLEGCTARVHAVQPAGCSTVVAAWERRDNTIVPVESNTRISGLSVPFDIDASLALVHLQKHNGMGFAVEDEEVYECQRMLLEMEGIFAEPAGAVALAGLRKALREGRIRPDESIVCLVTGSGFKDPEAITAVAQARPERFLSNRELREYLQEAVE